MKVVMLVPTHLVGNVQRTFDARNLVGVSVEFVSDAVELVHSIDIHGFYMDKLVVMAALFSESPEDAKQWFVDSLVDICDGMKTLKEIYIFDSAQILSDGYAESLSLYEQVIYQPQKVHISEILNIIMGDFKEQEVNNIDDSVKPRGLFSRIKNRLGKTNIEPEPGGASEPEPEPPLLADEDVVGSTQPEPNDEFDLGSLDFQDDTEQSGHIAGDELDMDYLNFDGDEEPVYDPVGENPVKLSDSPLIVDEPIAVQEPVIVPEITAVQDVTLEPQNGGKQKKQRKPKFSAPAPAPAPVSPRASFKQLKSYVDIFQKRTKIILCTGERRSGVSTCVSSFAEQIQRDGLSCLVIDLDFDNRGQSINFPFEHDPDDFQLTLSLVNAIKSSTSPDSRAIHLGDGLDLLGTSLYVEDPSLVYSTVTNDALQKLFTAALSIYDIILVDCPFSRLKDYSCLILMSHLIVHSMNTDIRSVYNTLGALAEHNFASSIDYNMYMSKAMLLLNCYVSHKWDGSEINENSVLQIMRDLTGVDSYLNLLVLGRVPHFGDYDKYMNGGLSLVDNAKYSNVFTDLLDQLAARG